MRLYLECGQYAKKSHNIVINFLWKHLHEHVTRINGVSIRKWVLDYNIFQMFRISDWFQSIYIDSKRCYYWKGLWKWACNTYPAVIYLLKVKSKNLRTRCEICWKWTTKVSEQRYWRRSGVFIVNFEHISHLALVFLLLTLNL